MSDAAHRYNRIIGGCACGSAWNYYDEACSSLRPIPKTPPVVWDRWAGYEAPDPDAECYRGHAHCTRC